MAENWYIAAGDDGGHAGTGWHDRLGMFAPSLIGSGGPDPYIVGPLPGWAAAFPPSQTPARTSATFPLSGWDPELLGWVIAGRFAQMSDDDWNKLDPGPPEKILERYGQARRRDGTPATSLATDLDIFIPKDMNEEFSLLAYLSQSPPGDELLEIQAQNNGILGYFSKLLACSAETRPNMFALINVCLQVGTLVAMRFKYKYCRPRPAELWAALVPLIPTPRHPAFPSGHALQSKLIALCAGELVPEMNVPLNLLANRIARNRERALVHFRTDSVASQNIALAVHDRLMQVDEFKVLRDAIRGNTAAVIPPEYQVSNTISVSLPPPPPPPPPGSGGAA